MRRILDDLAQAHESAEYQQLLGNSEKKSAEEKQLKDQRDYAVKELMRGKAANRSGKNPELALQFRDGMRVGSMTVLHNLSIGEGGEYRDGMVVRSMSGDKKAVHLTLSSVLLTFSISAMWHAPSGLR